MGKYIIQWAVPAILLIVLIVYPAVKWWYLKRMPKHLKENDKINKASEKYDRKVK